MSLVEHVNSIINRLPENNNKNLKNVKMNRLRLLKLHWRLPKDFIDFFRYIGNDTCYFYAIIEVDDDFFVVDNINGIDNNEYSIKDKLNTYEGRIPKRFIPFADSPFGNLFVISVRGKDRGNVYHWDHHLEYDEEQDECNLDDYVGNLTKVSNSFTEFILKLKFDESLLE